jgi:hypothetical protein
VDETSEPESKAAVEADPPAGHLSADEPAPRPGVSRKTLIVAVLLAALIAGVAGAAIGWKVEQQRVKDDVASIRPIGVVRASDEDSVRIRLLTASGARTYVITDDTVVAGADGEGGAGIPEGAIVLVRAHSVDGEDRAREIIVLPDSTSYAERVAEAAADG